MKKLLDAIGSLFVYRSPTNSREAMRKNLMCLSSKKLAKITGISAHYSKAVVISRYLNEHFSHL
tara:strand:- start:2646 stop:2837 length:192 start_codon:yes stop_codon:yes gene_type:complete